MVNVDYRVKSAVENSVKRWKKLKHNKSSKTDPSYVHLFEDIARAFSMMFES